MATDQSTQMKLHQLSFRNGVYLAFELSSASRSSLLRRFPPKFSREICHHVTIERRITEESLAAVQAALGKEPRVHVTGYLCGDGVECFSVVINGNNKRLDGKYYHVTHSVEPPKKPVDSNGVMADAYGVPHEKLQKFELTGAWRLIKG